MFSAASLTWRFEVSKKPAREEAGLLLLFSAQFSEFWDLHEKFKSSLPPAPRHYGSQITHSIALQLSDNAIRTHAAKMMICGARS